MTSGPRALSAWAHGRGASGAGVGLLAFAACALLTLRGGIPLPDIHDEFSYLLAADTFAHGRLTNPTPPAWKSLESPHILVRPTYMSKYPPAQGLFLALGQVLTHLPIVGVWISLALACAAIVWMLQAWVPTSWAAAGGLIAIFRLVCVGEDARWSQSYWGGGVAALGGALVVGGLRHVWDHGRARDATLLALGLVLLANSRPFEGLVVSLPMLGALAVWLWRQPAGLRVRVVAPVVMVLVLGGTAMALYNLRVTGKLWRLPYNEYSSQYSMAPEFLWLPARHISSYENLLFMRLYLVFLKHFQELHTWRGYFHEMWLRLVSLSEFFVGVPLFLSVVGLPGALRDRWTRFAALSVGVLLAGMATVSWYHTHYAAPAACLVTLLIVQSLRQLRAWHGPVGRWLVAAIAIGCVVSTTVSVWRGHEVGPWTKRRAEIAHSLEARGGRHLVFVQSGLANSMHQEWVYNGAELATEPVVWAHDLGAEQDKEVLAAFTDRTAWRLDVDEKNPTLVPYVPEPLKLGQP